MPTFDRRRLDQLTGAEAIGARLAIDHIRRLGLTMEKTAKGLPPRQRDLLLTRARALRDGASVARRDLTPVPEAWNI